LKFVNAIDQERVTAVRVHYVCCLNITSPLLQGTGGYDRCPRAVSCGAPYWSQPFTVTISDDAYKNDVRELADVVMPDGNWEAMPAWSPYPKWAAWKATRDQGRRGKRNVSLSTLSMETAVLHPFMATKQWSDLWDFGCVVCARAHVYEVATPLCAPEFGVPYTYGG